MFLRFQSAVPNGQGTYPGIFTMTNGGLETVAETGSLSSAAEALWITQQAVSARIRLAERAVDNPLVHRSSTGSLLTKTGRVVAGLTGPVLDASHRLETGLHELRVPTGSFVIAASRTIAELLLPA